MSGAVVHCKRAAFDVYVGRPTKWGNPFTHDAAVKDKHPELVLVDTRHDAVTLYQDWLLGMVELASHRPPTLIDILGLRGKTLGCWCHPLACHADVLVEIANMSASDYVHLDVKLIKAETDKALLLVLDDDSEHWVPLSLVADSDDYNKGDKNCTVSVAKWFCVKEGLADGD